MPTVPQLIRLKRQAEAQPWITEDNERARRDNAENRQLERSVRISTDTLRRSEVEGMLAQVNQEMLREAGTFYHLNGCFEYSTDGRSFTRTAAALVELIWTDEYDMPHKITAVAVDYSLRIVGAHSRLPAGLVSSGDLFSPRYPTPSIAIMDDNPGFEDQICDELAEVFYFLTSR